MESSRGVTLASNRGPLRFVILAATGVDVNRCAACEYCYVDETLQAKFDMEIWEVLSAACEDKPGALANQTIWALAEVCREEVRCSSGVDVVTVAQALCHEAHLRGLAPQQVGEGKEHQAPIVQRNL